MFYALATLGDYIVPKIDKFIALAPCAFQGVNEVRSYDGFFSTLEEFGIFAIYAEGWNDKWNEMCSVYKEPCDVLGSQPGDQ